MKWMVWFEIRKCLVLYSAIPISPTVFVTKPPNSVSISVTSDIYEYDRVPCLMYISAHCFERCPKSDSFGGWCSCWPVWFEITLNPDRSWQDFGCNKISIVHRRCINQAKIVQISSWVDIKAEAEEVKKPKKVKGKMKRVFHGKHMACSDPSQSQFGILLFKSGQRVRANRFFLLTFTYPRGLFMLLPC